MKLSLLSFVPLSLLVAAQSSECTKYYTAVKGDTCDSIAKKFGITTAEFEYYNPSVGATCSNLVDGQQYCVSEGSNQSSSSSSSTKTTAHPTSTKNPVPSPTQKGLVKDCQRFYLVKPAETCTEIVNKFGTFTLDQFIHWNPAVGPKCTKLYAKYYVCVGVPGTPTTHASSKPTATGPHPTQTGIIKSCTKYYRAQTGDTCTSIAKKFGTFTVEQFEKWNPAVGKTCTRLLAGYEYCVAAPGGTAPKGPQPQQPGIVKNCNKYHFVQSGQTCTTIAKQSGISLGQFFKWNTGINDKCTNLEAKTYCCVGVS